MKIPARPLAIGASVLALATLTACVAPQPVYQTARYPYQPTYQAAPSAYAEYGHVANIEVIRSQTAGAGTTGGGAVAGGVLGGVVGNQFGHGGGRAAMTALGVFGGAVAGNSVEQNQAAAARDRYYRVFVRFDDGERREFNYSGLAGLHSGERVRLHDGALQRG